MQWQSETTALNPWSRNIRLMNLTCVNALSACGPSGGLLKALSGVISWHCYVPHFSLQKNIEWNKMNQHLPCFLHKDQLFSPVGESAAVQQRHVTTATEGGCPAPVCFGTDACVRACVLVCARMCPSGHIKMQHLTLTVICPCISKDLEHKQQTKKKREHSRSWGFFWTAAAHSFTLTFLFAWYRTSNFLHNHHPTNTDLAPPPAVWNW